MVKLKLQSATLFHVLPTIFFRLSKTEVWSLQYVWYSAKSNTSNSTKLYHTHLALDSCTYKSQSEPLLETRLKKIILACILTLFTTLRCDTEVLPVQLITQIYRLRKFLATLSVQHCAAAWFYPRHYFTLKDHCTSTNYILH